MNPIFKKANPLFFLFFPILIFFAPVLLQNKIPLPADTLPGLHHPLKDALRDEYPNGPPYKNFLITDSVRQQYPWRQFSINQLKLGQIPWWNPYNFSGTPHLANFQSATFYPLNIVYWLVDFPTGWTIQIILQQILGATFLFLYLRNQKLSKLSSIFGSLTWIFSGFFIAWLEWNTAAHVALWSPMILLSIDKLFTNKKSHYLTWSLMLIFSLFAQLTAGYPQPWLYFSILQSLYVIYRYLQTKNKQGLSICLTAFIAFIVLGLVQLQPTLQYSSLSNRDFDQGGSEYNLTRADWFIPYQNLIQTIVPDFFGNPATLNYWGVFNYTEFVSFIGIIPMFLILSLIFTKKRPTHTAFFTLTLLSTLLFALKNPISVTQIKLDIPFISGSQPSRLIVIINFVLSILAAFGFHRFTKHKQIKFKPLAILVIVIISAWAWTLFVADRSSAKLLSNLQVTKRNLLLPSLEIGGLFILLLALRVKYLSRFKLKQFLPLILIVLSSLVGIRFALKFTPFSDKSFLYPDSKLLSTIGKDQEYYRYATTDRRIMAPNINLPYNLYTIEGYDPMYLADYGRLISAADNNIIPDQSRPFNRTVLTDQILSPLIDLLGVKYILTFNDLTDPSFTFISQEGDTKLFLNTQVLPRAFLTDNTDPFSQNLSTIIPATITHYSPNKVTILANAPDQTTLILSDAYYPAWHATLDGESIEVHNWHGLRATIIPRGEHEIVYQYRHSKL